MTNKDLTYVLGIIDRSGSMAYIADDTAGGWNALVKAQAEQPGTCKVTLVDFDDVYEVKYKNVLASDAPEYVLQPRGGTALYDAVGRAITDLGVQLARLPEEERPGLVTVAILTDGHENSSREWSSERLKTLIEKQTNEYSWVINFMGANQDAILAANKIGIAGGFAVTYDTHNTRDVFAATSNNYIRTRSAVIAGASAAVAGSAATYSDEDRKKAAKKK